MIYLINKDFIIIIIIIIISISIIIKLLLLLIYLSFFFHELNAYMTKTSQNQFIQQSYRAFDSSCGCFMIKNVLIIVFKGRILLIAFALDTVP